MRSWFELSAVSLILIGVGIIIGSYDAWSTPLEYALPTADFAQDDSPGNRIDEHQIKVNRNDIILDVPNAVLIRLAPTGSMEPWFSEHANLLELPVTSSTPLKVGDIISFTTPYSDDIIVHRIAEITEKNGEPCYKTEGVASGKDPGCRLSKDILRVVIGILY